VGREHAFIAEFEAQFNDRLKAAPVPSDLVDEGDVERHFIFS